MNRFYHNPKCSKSRDALQYLESVNEDFEIVEYLKSPPSADEIKDIHRKLDCQIIKMVRTKEKLFSELGLSEKDEDKQKWYEVLAEHPSLLERPIYVSDLDAAIGRPLEKIKLMVVLSDLITV